jgi:hypothetical protein
MHPNPSSRDEHVLSIEGCNGRDSPLLVDAAVAQEAFHQLPRNEQGTIAAGIPQPGDAKPLTLKPAIKTVMHHPWRGGEWQRSRELRDWLRVERSRMRRREGFQRYGQTK